jgi:hypothetical protein
VQAVDARIRSLVADMLETMYDANGIGLAATQVDVHERVVVIDISEERNQPLVLINPEITWASDEKAGRRRGLPVGARHLRRRGAVQRDQVRRSTARASRARSRPRACWPCASSTRWTTCWARSSSNTCRR